MISNSTNTEVEQGLERKVYSVEDVSIMLDVSKEHVHRQIRAGLIPHKRVGRRVVIPCALFDQWLSTSDNT